MTNKICVFRLGDAPLWTALESEQEEIASVLIRHGVDTDCWNSTGPDGCLQTLLHRAIDENRESAAIFLIRSRCDLDSPRQPGPNGEGKVNILYTFTKTLNAKEVFKWKSLVYTRR